MNIPKIPKRSYYSYKDRYHKLVDRILRENRILYHTKKQPKIEIDMGDKDSGFIPKDKR